MVGCFPNNAKHRTYAKLGEGALVASGIAMLAVTNTGADCSPVLGRPGVVECREKATIVGNVGLGMILVGMLGFVATVSTAPEDKTVAPLPEAPKAPMPVAVPELPGKKPAAAKEN
jgi:hypothetical protein